MPSNEWLLITVGAILVNNVVLSRILGICPFLGVSKRLETAMGMSGAVIFVMTIASFVTAILHKLLLAVKLNIFGYTVDLSFTRILVFIVVIASLVQIVEILLKKFSPALYASLGIYLPLITTNCAVLSAALLTIQNEYNFIEAVCFCFASAIGFTLAIVVFAGVRSRMQFADPPRAFRGFPLTLIAAGLLAMAFSGFSGMSFS